VSRVSWMAATRPRAQDSRATAACRASSREGSSGVPLDSDGRPETGLAALDVQHRQVIRRLERLAAATAEGRADEVTGALRFLERYLADHFDAEERWMVEQGYPGSIEHARVHATVLVGIADARRAVEFVGIAAQALDKARHAVDEHLRVDDLRLRQFLVARDNLRRLAEGPGGGTALTPIPGALEALTPPPRKPPLGVFPTPIPGAHAVVPGPPHAQGAPPPRFTVVRGGKA
jgi:hemerythrin